jgi:hypothetical protein
MSLDRIGIEVLKTSKLPYTHFTVYFKLFDVSQSRLLLVFIIHGGDDMLLIIFVLEEHKVEQLITF